MKLFSQLRDEELTDLLLEAEDREMQQLFEGAPQSLHSAADRPPWFWQRQRGGIRERVAASERTWPALAAMWAGAVVLPVLAFVMLKSAPAPQPVQAHTDSDQELMIAVERVMQTEVPEALEPTALLATEIGAGENSQRTSRRVHKESSNDE